MSYNGTETYILKKLDLVSNQGNKFSLINIFNSFNIVEDIFCNFIYGSITFSDGNDLHQIVPIIGEEKLQITYATDDVTDRVIDLSFRVYKIESSEATTDRITHKLYFISDEGYLNNTVSISKSYKNVSPNFIVTDALGFISNKGIDFTPTSGKHHIISPNWSPFQLINYVAGITTPKNYTGSLVLFYQSTHGFKFKHIEDLYNQKSVGTWTANELRGRVEPTEEINKSKAIHEYTPVRNSVDTLKSLSEGLFANATISYDSLTKTHKTFIYNYNDNFKDTVHLNKFKLTSNNFDLTSPTQRIVYLPSNTHRNESKLYNSTMKMNVGDNKEVIQTWRTSLLSQLKAKEIHLEVAGDTNVCVGSIINIELPNTSSLKSMKMNSHRYNRKKVIITKISHEFTRRKHTMKLIVSDDSYSDTLDGIKEHIE